MRPVVSVAEMVAFDAAALETTSHETLVNRAGYAVAMQAIKMLGVTTGRRVVIVAGKGSNGADGHVCASVLRSRGAKVVIVSPDAPAEALRGAALVIDAAVGTGLRRDYVAPRPPDDVAVLSVDLPSGLDGDTGVAHGQPFCADVTVTMGALKAGQLLGDGPDLCGDLVVADIGIDASGASMALVDDDDFGLIPPRERTAHKWSAAVVAVAGSDGMEGAAALSALGALHAGAGMVRLVTTGSLSQIPLEVVSCSVSAGELAETALRESARAGALLLGPGLGDDPMVQSAVRGILEHRTVPVVLDADGLGAVGTVDELARLVAARPHGVVCTPHDGELARLLGRLVGADWVERLIEAVDATGATFLSKGSTTVIVSPGVPRPEVRFVTSGTTQLATAGTGDVLAGILAALIARGMSVPDAASIGAHLHGRASSRGSGTLVAAALPHLVGEVLEEALHNGR